MLLTIIAIILSYLLGSVPTAYIFGRVFKGIDIRKHGSGNVGATNAFRVLGKGIGIAVLCIDILKGLIAILLAQVIVSRVAVSAELFRIIIGLSCILGHTWTVFLKFKGGKGIATALGVLIGIALQTPNLGSILIMAVLTWILCFTFFRIVSLASIVSAVSLPLYVLIFKQSIVIIVTCTILSVFVIVRHNSNIKRLLEGKEPKLKLK